MKKNVWILNHYATGMMFNEGGRHYWFAKFLRQKGYEPVVFCCNAKHGVSDTYFDPLPLWQKHIAEKINTPFVVVKARTYVGNGKQRVFNMIDFYYNVKKAAKEYAKLHGKPDVIYASSVHPLTLVAGIQLAKYFGVKCICEVRDLWPESLVAYGMLERENIITKMLYMGEKYIYSSADIIIMTWPGGYDYILDQNWENEIDKSKVVHINNGVDLEEFNLNMEQNPYVDEDLNNDICKAFVYAGSIRKVNNLKLLVDAAEIIKNRSNGCMAKIVVFGDGDEREQLQKLVEEKRLDNIVFKGQVDKKYIPSILKQSYVSILHNTSTELNKYGQSQNKFFEYLAVGHPILMTYSVGHSICKSNNCGLELENQTPDAIANAIEYFDNLSEEEYCGFCNRTLSASKKYDFYELTKELIEIIENC